MGVKELCLSYLNHGIFAKEAAKTTHVEYFTYVYSHMKVYVTDKSLCKEENVMARVVGEKYAELLPTRTKIDEESAAKLHFTSVVRIAFKSVKASNPDFTVCLPPGLIYEGYERDEEFKICYKAGTESKKYPNPFKNPVEFKETVRKVLELNNKKADVGSLFDVAYDIVLMLALMMVPARVNLSKEVTFLTFVTFAKKGLANEEYIKKFETVVQEELELNVNLNPTQMSKLWKSYEPLMSADLMQHCVKLTLAEVPEGAARLRKLVELCKWRGLTCYRAVKQALDLPGFPWDRLTKMEVYRREMEAFKEAEQLVGENAFYGYNPSMGKAKSPRYKNLASACAKILVETGKSPNMDKAACFTKAYPSKNIVDGIVTEFARQNKTKFSGSKEAKSSSPGSKAKQVQSTATTTSKSAGLPKNRSSQEQSGAATSAPPKSSTSPKTAKSTDSGSNVREALAILSPLLDFDYDDFCTGMDALSELLPDENAEICADHWIDDTPDWDDNIDNDWMYDY